MIDRLRNIKYVHKLLTFYGTILLSCLLGLFVGYGISIISFAIIFSIGIFLWTFIEYFTHRYILHDDYLDNIALKEHLGHHGEPDITKLIATPLSATVITAIIIFIILCGLNWLAFNSIVIGLGIFAGSLSGYLFYEWAHYYIHTHKPKGRYMKWCKNNHWPHHFGDDKYNFGVTNSIWDLFFKTNIKYRKKKDGTKPTSGTA